MNLNLDNVKNFKNLNDRDLHLVAEDIITLKEAIINNEKATMANLGGVNKSMDTLGKRISTVNHNLGQAILKLKEDNDDVSLKTFKKAVETLNTSQLIMSKQINEIQAANKRQMIPVKQFIDGNGRRIDTLIEANRDLNKTVNDLQGKLNRGFFGRLRYLFLGK